MCTIFVETILKIAEEGSFDLYDVAKPAPPTLPLPFDICDVCLAAYQPSATRVSWAVPRFREFLSAAGYPCSSATVLLRHKVTCCPTLNKVATILSLETTPQTHKQAHNDAATIAVPSCWSQSRSITRTSTTPILMLSRAECSCGCLILQMSVAS